MCLAVPMQISCLLEDNKALVKQGEIEIEISTSLLEKVEVGDYVIVHAGFGIDLLDLQEAEERLELFRQMKELG
jgi:hydrogenase expression/formation protein HypC